MAHPLPGYAKSDPITEAHEERIQRLEGSLPRIEGIAAATEVKVDNIGEKIDTGFRIINARLDKGDSRFEANETVQATQGSEIGKLKDAEAARTVRWQHIKAVVIPTLTAAAGVIVTKFGAGIWAWIVQVIQLAP